MTLVKSIQGTSLDYTRFDSEEDAVRFLGELAKGLIKRNIPFSYSNYTLTINQQPVTKYYI